MPASLLVQLGRVIVYWRKRAGYSQESFADRVGIHRNEMGEYERGERDMRLSTVGRIGAALNRSTAQLLVQAERWMLRDGTRERKTTGVATKKQM